MAKGRRQQNEDDDIAAPTKEENQIGRFLRLSCPSKQGMCMGNKVDYFVANKLVDCLADSKWGPSGKNKDKSPLFSSRQACIAFMDRLMSKRFFHRALKVYKEIPAAVADSPKRDADSSTTPSALRKRKVKDNQNNTTDTETPAAGKNRDGVTKREQKRKFKLEVHDDQRFIDDSEPYVWVFDPTPTKTYVIGLLLILGSIGVCLFPLWPSSVRDGVYYISLAGAAFLGSIIGLAVVKYIVFALVWIVSMGKLSLWIFPNLTEDVGFVESFIPVYKYSLADSAAIAASGDEKTEKQSEQKEQVTSKPAEQPADVVEAAADVAEDSPSNFTRSATRNKMANSELSNSTVVINKISSDSPLTRTKRGSVSKSNEDEEFELVDRVAEDEEQNDA